MDDPRRMAKNALGLQSAIGADLDSFGGVHRCHVCGHEEPLKPGDAGYYLRHGWPRHCGHQMRWVTARELAAEATQTDTGPTPPAFDDADATTAQSSITCDLCGFSDFTSKKVTDDDAEDEELAQLEYVRYTCRNCGHQWHEAV